MRILYVYHMITAFGGIERVLVDKMNGLAQAGCDVCLLTADQGSHAMPFRLDERVRYEDMHVMTFIQYRYKGLRRLWEYFRRHKLLYKRLAEKLNDIHPDVIVSTTNGYISELAQLKGSAPLVIESHSGYDHVMERSLFSWYNYIQMKLLYRKLRKADVIVTLTERDAKKWRRHYPCVRTMPNVVHLNASGQYSTCEQKRVIFVGRNCKQKAIPDLLKIWQMVHEVHPDWQLDMYVEREKSRLVEEAESLHANIHVYSPVSDIMGRYLQSSVFVQTSLYEPFGLAMAEAMSCGLPVVAFEGDGPCSILTDGVDGYVVAGRSKEDFARRVCQLIEDRELRLRMGRRAVESVQRFSLDTIIPQWKDLFESIV